MKAILIAEDDKLNAQLLRDVVIDCGLKPYVETDTKQLVELAVMVSPCLILTDLHLNSTTVVNSIEQIRTQAVTKHIPVVVISGSASGRDKAAAISAGCTHYLEKPVDIIALMKMIKDAKIIVKFYMSIRFLECFVLF